ncbi:MAG: radical SAM family heme chaperone HemW [Treponema sp.]|nr:radical SAM family heme chaperone HemW [Treponema sp.]MEE3436225.1 radical SAM family heme chaperone HemW [Treponema sp.]
MKPPLYVHIPYCLQKCGYCDFFSKAASCVPPEYVRAVARQLEHLARAFCVEGWKSVYIGGGSPSLLGAEDLEFLCASIKAAALNKAAPLDENCEWTIEMNPETVSRPLLEKAASCGINRLSVGIQCKNDKVLRAIGRRASERDIEKAAELIKNFWPHEWSADLIAGLPFQTKKDIERDISFIERKGAKHVSLYSLTLEEGTPLKGAIDAGKIPYDEEAAEELWLYGRDLLEGKGFAQYEVSNFARPGFESIHNGAYWAQESYLGAGAGAAGTIYGKPTGWRYTNVLDAAEYIKFWLEEAKGFTDLNAGRANQEASQDQEARGQDCLQDQNCGDQQKGFTDLNAGGAKQEASQDQNVRAALAFPCQLEALDMATQEFEYIMTNLRTRRGASAAEYQARYGGDLAARLGCKEAAQGQKAGEPKGFTDLNEGGGDCLQGLNLRTGQKGFTGQNAGAAAWLTKTERSGDAFYSMTCEGLLFLNRFLEEL